MKEFIEKLIGRLEEEKEKAFSQYRESFELYREEFWRGRMGGFTNAIEIVNQLRASIRLLCNRQKTTFSARRL